MTKQLNVKIIKSPEIKIKIDGAKGLDGTGSVSFVNTGTGIGVYTSTINSTISLKSIKSISNAITVALESGAIGVGLDQTKLNLQKSQINNLVADLNAITTQISTINGQITTLNSFKTTQNTLNTDTANQIANINNNIININNSLTSIQTNLNTNNTNINYLLDSLSQYVYPQLTALVQGIDELYPLLVGSNKGDLIVFDGSGYSAVPSGSNGQVLTADSSSPTGLSYRTPTQVSAPVQSVAGKTGNITLNKNDVSLGNVDNTSDLDKPVSTATQSALNNKVDKINGKGLSTEDYTTTEKTKLSGLKPVLAGSNIVFDTTTNPNAIIINSTASGGSGGAVTSVAGKVGDVTLTKSDVGLNNIDNTSDLNKPISTATQTALDNKVDKVNGKGLSTNDYTTTEKTKLSTLKAIQAGSNITFDTTTDPTKIIINSTASGGSGGAVTSVAGKTGNVTLNKSDVGLNNVDNTSDLNKPISTATQTALDNKVDKVNGKDLSTEDYTTTEKTKLSNLHPIIAGNNITFDTTTTPGSTIINSTASGGSGGGLTYFSESTNDSGVNLTYPINSLNSNGSSPDLDVAFVPKGLGGFMLSVPDGTSVGGNKRGYYSVDFQIKRGDPDRIAKGQYNFIGGGYNNGTYGSFSAIVNGVNNIINGNYGFIGNGNANTVNNDYSAVLCGANNIATNSYSSVVGGQGNQAIGSASLAGGGQYNIANSAYSVVLGGMYNQTQGDCSYSAIIGGYQNNMNNSGYGSIILGGYNNYINVTTSSNVVTIVGGQNNIGGGQYSIILGGNYNKTDADYSCASGQSAYTKGIKGAQAYSCGNWNGYGADGATQELKLILRGRTNNNDSNYTLTTDNAGVGYNYNQLTVRNNEIKQVKGTVIICETNNVTNYIKYDIDVIFCRYQDSIIILNDDTYSPVGNPISMNNGCSLIISTDSTNNALKFSIRKSSGPEIGAIATLISSELAF